MSHGPTPVIRARRRGDLPELGRVLFEQQPRSRYPFRDPLPIPVDTFLHADDAEGAWTAELDGRPVGHVCRTRSSRNAESDANERCALAHGCDVTELAWVSALFVAESARGTGTGRRLLTTVTDHIVAAGRYACLEVLTVQTAAAALYASCGWHEVARTRPGWLAQASDRQDTQLRVLIRRAHG